MKFRYAKKLHNGDQVMVRGEPAKVLSTEVLDTKPPSIIVKVILNDGRGGYEELIHTEVG